MSTCKEVLCYFLFNSVVAILILPSQVDVKFHPTNYQNYNINDTWLVHFGLSICIGVIEQSSSNRQVLDKLPVERQRGITVKAQTATMFTILDGQSYMVNLIDTPVSEPYP